jgi:hypothetical protein
VICLSGDATVPGAGRWRLASGWTALTAGGLLLAMLVTVQQTLEPAHASVWLGGGQP